MIISKELFIFLGSVLLLANNAFAERIETNLSPLQIELGQRAFFDVKFISDPSDKTHENMSEISLSDEFLLQHKKIKVLDKKIIKDEGFPIVRYEITAYSPEELRIPPIQIKWAGEQLSTESTPLLIKSSRLESDTEIREAFQEVSKPFPLWRILRLVALALFTYFVCWIFWPYLLKIPGLFPTVRFPLKKEKEEDPLDWLKRELEALKKKRAQWNESQELIDDWFHIVKTYFAKKEKKTVRSWTTKEFKNHLNQNQKAAEVIPLLQACDQFKFSKDRHSTVSTLMEKWILETERILICGN